MGNASPPCQLPPIRIWSLQPRHAKLTLVVGANEGKRNHHSHCDGLRVGQSMPLISPAAVQHNSVLTNPSWQIMTPLHSDNSFRPSLCLCLTNSLYQLQKKGKAKGAFSYSARTAPIIMLFLLGTPLRNTHLQKNA